MRKSLVSIFLLIAVIAAGQLSLPARPAAAADVEVITDSTTNQFPNGIRFDFYFSSDQPVSDVRLRFHILPDGVPATVQPQCTEGRVMNCQAVVGNVGQTYMVPGAEVVYSWTVTDDSGGRFQTDEKSVFYEDSRFQWEELTEGNLTLHYYFGDEATQRSVLQLAQDTIDRFSKIEDTTLDFPVKIWVYKTAEDMQPAVASRRGQGDDDSIQTLGEVGASDTALVSTDTDYLDIVRHELTHVVTGAATRDHLVEIPVWLNEGLSTYAQNQLLPNESNALANAIRSNGVFPITSLGVSTRSTGNAVSLFYAQSGSIVGFMIDKLGEDKFAQFIHALKDDTVDGALQNVYGFDLLGLENQWRAAVGLPEGGAATPTPSAAPSQTAGPTATPRTAQSQNNNDRNNGDSPRANSNASSDGAGISAVVIVLVALIAAFVILLGAAGFFMFRGHGPES
jgi:hypothetical protein